MTVDKASVTDPPTNTIHTYGTFTDGIHFTTITDQDKADIKAYDFTLRKVDAGNVNTLLDGARFQIQRNGKWMNLDWNTVTIDDAGTSNTDDWNGYRAKPLASTGTAVLGLAGGALAVLLAGGSLLVFRKRHYAQGSGRHTAVNAGK